MRKFNRTWFQQNYIRRMRASPSTEQAAEEEDRGVVISIHSKVEYTKLLEENKTSNKMLVIYFSASWCGPCRFIEPTFKALSINSSGDTFLKIDVDELPEVSKTWKVEAMPTFVIIKGGQEITRVVGAKKEKLEKNIKENSSLEKNIEKNSS